MFPAPPSFPLGFGAAWQEGWLGVGRCGSWQRRSGEQLPALLWPTARGQEPGFWDGVLWLLCVVSIWVPRGAWLVPSAESTMPLCGGEGVRVRHFPYGNPRAWVCGEGNG